MRRLSALSYFAAVTPPAAPLVVVLAALAVAAAAIELVDAGSSDWVLASILLIQLFASSTGFTRHATRGHYDPVFLGTSRFTAALAHLTISGGPGFLAWTVAGVAEAVASQSVAVPAFLPSGWAALLLVSTVPWAASVRTAPFLGGALWMVISVSLLTSGTMLERLMLFHAHSAWAGEHPVGALALGLAFPLVVPSLDWPPSIVFGLVAVAAAAAAAGVLAVCATDFPLAEEGP